MRAGRQSYELTHNCWRQSDAGRVPSLCTAESSFCHPIPPDAGTGRGLSAPASFGRLTATKGGRHGSNCNRAGAAGGAAGHRPARRSAALTQRLPREATSTTGSVSVWDATGRGLPPPARLHLRTPFGLNCNRGTRIGRLRPRDNRNGGVLARAALTPSSAPPAPPDQRSGGEWRCDGRAGRRGATGCSAPRRSRPPWRRCRRP